MDTKFAVLLHPELIGIGLVSIAGGEFYAELHMASEEGQKRKAASCDFVRYGGVLDL